MPKLTQVREKGEVEEGEGKEEEKEGEKIWEEQETSKNRLHVASLKEIHDGVGCLSSEVCNIASVDGRELLRTAKVAKKVGKKDIFNEIESADAVQGHTVTRTEGRFIYLKSI